MVSVGKALYFGKERVHPEFFGLMRIPFELFTSITFEKTSVRKSKSEKTRRECLNRLFDRLHENILERHPDISSGRHTIRAVWVIEYGAQAVENERHCHLLIHIDQRFSEMLKNEVYADLVSISPAELSEMGIATKDTQLIREKSKVVSYICKVERGLEYKKFDSSKGFMRIIQKINLPYE
ncbi:MAG: hypothetical protein WCL71_02740 [Deltaproteobacteria bacterium]